MTGRALRFLSDGVAVVALAVAPAGCSSTGEERPTQGDETHRPVGSSATGNAPPTITEEGPNSTVGPDLNPVEDSLIAVLSSVGVTDPGVAEFGFREASIYGDWQGRTVLVHQYELGQPTTPGEVVDSTTIKGQPVEIVATDSFGDLARFRCGEYGFDVGSFPIGWPSESRSDRSAAETFLVVLIPELACD